MRDIHSPLRELYVTTLNAFIVYESDAIPDDAVTPYIILGNTSAIEQSNKSDFGNTIQITLDIVTSFSKNVIGGSKTVDAIASQILAGINSKTVLQLSNGLQIVTTKILQDKKLSASSTTHRIFRRFIKFEHLIMQNYAR